MKRKIIWVIAAVLIVALSANAFAATTVSDVQALEQQVSAKITELNTKTLTSAQKKTLASVEKSFAKLLGNSANSSAPKQDTDREAKLTAFKATLTEAQKTAFEEIMPQMPGGMGSGARPSGSPPPTPAAGEKPQGSPPPAGERKQMQMSDADKAAMEAKRTAFVNTLSESQKQAFEQIFPSQPADAAQQIQQPQQAASDLSKLTASQLAKREKSLKSMLTKLGKLG